MDYVKLGKFMCGYVCDAEGKWIRRWGMIVSLKVLTKVGVQGCLGVGACACFSVIV